MKKQINVVNGITVYGTKSRRNQQNGSFAHETSAVNFTSLSNNGNIGKIAVYMKWHEVHGRILDPDSAETCDIVYHGKILAEDKNSFIIALDDNYAVYVMKFPELYTLFRIVDNQEEVEIICEMIDNYARNLFERVNSEWPFDVNFLDKMEESICCYRDVPVEQQNAVMEKLKQTKFKSFREQTRND